MTKLTKKSFNPTSNQKKKSQKNTAAAIAAAAKEQRIKLNRYKSHDDLDVGALMQRNEDTNIAMGDDTDSPKHSQFKAIRSHNRTASRLSLTKQLSLDADLNTDTINGGGNVSGAKGGGPEPGTFHRNRSHSQPKNVLIPQMADSRCNGWRYCHHCVSHG